MTPTYNFNGPVALVTGAGSGIGLAAAKAFAQSGAAVVLAGRQERALHAAAEDLVEAGHQAVVVVCDVADEDQAAAMVERTSLPLAGSTWPTTTRASSVRCAR